MSKTLMQALMNMHAEFGVILEKDKKGNRGTYTSLPGVLSQIHAMTKKHGLILTQRPRVSGEYQVLTTYLHHPESGESIISESQLTPATNNPSPDQAYGSSLTYHRRYDAMALLGLFCDEDPSDHDGWRDHDVTQPNASHSVQTINEKQVGLLKYKLQGKDAIHHRIIQKYGSLGDVPANMMNTILQWIESEK